MSDGQKLTDRWSQYRPTKSTWFWSCAAVAVATMVIGFTVGGWTTGGTAQEMAEEAAEDARAQLASTLCVDRFVSAPNASSELAALKEASSYERDDMIEDGGFTTFANMEDSVSGAADLCAEQLVALEEIPGATAEAEAEIEPVSTDG